MLGAEQRGHVTPAHEPSPGSDSDRMKYREYLHLLDSSDACGKIPLISEPAINNDRDLSNLISFLPFRLKNISGVSGSLRP